MARYRAVVVGCGNRGRQHAMGFLKSSDRFDLVAICDTDEARLGKVAEELASEPWNAPLRTYADAGSMLAEEKPDVYCFATLPTIRWPLVELGLEAGVRAIAYEKPMANSLAEAARIDSACREAGVKTVVAHIHKYGGHWIKAREIAASGDIGEVRLIHATSQGWLLQYATHLVDYMIWLNGGSRIKSVSGHVHVAGKLSDSHPSPDYALGRFEFENGVAGVIECGEGAPHFPGDIPFWLDAGATVYGSAGWAEVVVGAGWRAAAKGEPGLLGSCDVVFDQNENGFPYIRDLADWLDDGSKVHPCNGDVTWHGYQAVMATPLSAVEHRPGELPLTEDEIATDVVQRMRECL